MSSAPVLTIIITAADNYDVILDIYQILLIFHVDVLSLYCISEC